MCVCIKGLFASSQAPRGVVRAVENIVTEPVWGHGEYCGPDTHKCLQLGLPSCFCRSPIGFATNGPFCCVVLHGAVMLQLTSNVVAILFNLFSACSCIGLRLAPRGIGSRSISYWLCDQKGIGSASILSGNLSVLVL